MQMILRSFGRSVTARELRAHLPLGRNGTTALMLSQCAAAHNLRSQGFEVSAADAKLLPLPAILHLRRGHFVVMEQWTEQGAHIVDPAAGRYRIAPDVLARKLSGVALAFEPGVGFARRRETAAVWSVVAPALRIGRWPWIGLGALALLLTVVTYWLMTVVAQLFLAVTGRAGELSTAGREFAVFSGAVCSAILVYCALRSQSRAIGQRVGHHLATRIDQVARDARGSWFLRRSPNDLYQRLYACDPLTGVAFPDLAGIAAQIVAPGCALMLAASSPLAAAIALGLFCACAILSLLAGRFLSASSIEEGDALRDGQRAVRRILEQTRELRVAGELDFALRNWHLDRARAAGPSIRSAAVGDAVRVVHASLLMLLTAAACAATGIWSDGFASNLSSLRSIVVFLVVSALAYRIRYVVSSTARWVDALSRLDDALDTGEVAPDGAERADAQPDADPSLRASLPPLPPLEPALLDVRGVALHYGSPPEIILRDFDLVVKDGDRLAVIGGRGAGKTTLAQALLGEHEVMAGSIRHRGHVLRSHAGARGSAGVGIRGLVQGMTLRDGTIADNLRIGNSMVAFEQIVEACRRMGIAEDIAKMPLRYETLVRRDGSSVSRAQRQLLLLARTIASPCDLFVFDDPVAHLSPSSARQVVSALTCLDGAVIAFLADPCPVVGLGFRIVDLEAARPSAMSHVVVS